MRGEAGGHEGRGLVLGDHRRAGQDGPRHQLFAAVERHVDSTARPPVEEGAPALRHDPRPILHRRGLVRQPRFGRDQDRPAQRLDRRPRDRPREQRRVLFLEGLAQRRGVGIRQRAHRQGHGDLVALADIAHVGEPPLDRLLATGTRRHQRRRLKHHFGEQRVGTGRVEFVEAHVPAADQLERNRGREEPDRRADAGIGRHDDARHADLLRDARRVQRRRPAEGDQRVLADGRAALDRVHARRIRHVLAHHLVHRVGRHRPGKAERFADLAFQRPIRQLGLQRNGAAGERRRIDHAQCHVGVGHGRQGAAAAVAGGARLGSRTLRPHRDALQRIHLRDRAAAGADLDHLDHRDAHRQAAALQESRGAVDLEHARGMRLVVVDQADLGGGAAHVEGQCAAFAARGLLPGPRRWRRRRARIRPAAPETCAPSRSPSGRRPR